MPTASAGGTLKRLNVRVATIPSGFKDVADIFEKGGPTAGAIFEKMIADAVPAPVWAIDYAKRTMGAETPEQAQAALDFVMDYFASLPPALSDRYVGHLARELGLSVDAVRRSLNDWYRARKLPVPLRPSSRMVVEY